jgi:hypothetical protein
VLVLTRVILANLVLETELIVILTLSHHAMLVLLLVDSRVSTLWIPFFSFWDDSTMANLESLMHIFARMVAVVHVLINPFFIRIVLFCPPFARNTVRDLSFAGGSLG